MVEAIPEGAASWGWLPPGFLVVVTTRTSLNGDLGSLLGGPPHLVNLGCGLFCL